jgi:hypothetical protein
MKKLFEKIKNFKHKKLYILAGVLILTILIVPKNVSAFDLLNNIGTGVVMTFIKVIAEMVMWICATFLSMCGFVLDYSVKWTIGGFGAIAGDVGMVNIGWVIFRDLSNIVFIFLVLWIAISTVLGLSHDAPMGSILRIAIAAILVNFSLFVTKAVIDVSNIVALHFYNLITANGTQSFSGVFMKGMYLSTLYDPRSLDWANAELQSKIMIVFVFGSIAMLIAGWSFLAASVMFLIRSLYLIILMIFSPFAFIAWVIPGMGHLTHDWWNKLFKQAFFAPIFLIIIYIVGKTITTPGSFGLFGIEGLDKQNFTGIADAFTKGGAGMQDTGLVGIVFNFFMVIGMIIAALMSSDKLGATGAKTAISWGNHIRGAGQGLIGRSAVRYSGLRWLNEKFEHTQFGQTALGSTVRDLTTGYLAKKATFGGHLTAEEAHKEKLERDAVREDVEMEKGKRSFFGLGPKVESGMVDLAREIDNLETKESVRLETEERALADLKQRMVGVTNPNIQSILQQEYDTKAEKLKRDKESYKTNLRNLDDELSGIIVKMSPHTVTEMDKSTLANNQIMKRMTSGQVMAIKGSDRFTEDEKKHYLSQHFDDILKWNEANQNTLSIERAIQSLERDIRDGLAKGKNMSAEQQQLQTFQSQYKEAKKTAGKIGKVLYNRVRGMTLKQLEALHWTQPEAFKDREFVSLIRFGKIMDIYKQSEEFTETEKQRNRDYKVHGQTDAAERMMGLGFLPGEEDVKKWEQLAQDTEQQIAHMSPDLKPQFEPLLKVYKELSQIDPHISPEEWEEKKKEIKKILRGKEWETEGTMGSALAYEQYEKNYYDKWFGGANSQAAKDEMEEAGKALDESLLNRTAQEIAQMPGRVGQLRPILERTGRSTLNSTETRGKDTVDTKHILENNLWSYLQSLRHEIDQNFGKKMGEALKENLKFFKDTKEGRAFFNGALNDTLDLLEDLPGQDVGARLKAQLIADNQIKPGEKVTMDKIRKIMLDGYKI